MATSGKSKRRIAGDDASGGSPDLRKSSVESTAGSSSSKGRNNSNENLELLSPRPLLPVPSQYKERFNFGEQRMSVVISRTEGK